MLLLIEMFTDDFCRQLTLIDTRTDFQRTHQRNRSATSATGSRRQRCYYGIISSPTRPLESIESQFCGALRSKKNQ